MGLVQPYAQRLVYTGGKGLSINRHQLLRTTTPYQVLQGSSAVLTRAHKEQRWPHSCPGQWRHTGGTSLARCVDATILARASWLPFCWSIPASWRGATLDKVLYVKHTTQGGGKVFCKWKGGEGASSCGKQASV